jgi:hypothetical protein
VELECLLVQLQRFFDLDFFGIVDFAFAIGVWDDVERFEGALRISVSDWRLKDVRGSGSSSPS